MKEQEFIVYKNTTKEYQIPLL